MAKAWLVAVICACSGVQRATTPSRTGSQLPALIAAVGPQPRVVATVDLHDARIRAQLGELIAGHDCKLALDRLDSVRVAIGEPLRVAAEIDGAIDSRTLRCLLGEHAFAELTGAGFVVRDRDGGVAIERDLAQAPPSELASELVGHCAGRRSCIVGRLGPTAREVRFELAYDGTTLHSSLRGPGFAGASALVAAIDKLKATTPAFRAVAAHDVEGALVIDSPWPVREQLAGLIETSTIPASSSMVPTLVQGDHVYGLAGPLRGPIVPGTVVVLRADNGKTYIKRVIAGAGATITETEQGIAIDGMPLPTTEISGNYPYVYDFGNGATTEHAGKLVREQLRDRSYLTLRRMSPSAAFARSKQRGSPGSWTIPPGQLFVLGDNRDDSYDSRYMGPIREDAIIGRVTSIWFALRGELPDWDRMGSTIE